MNKGLTKTTIDTASGVIDRYKESNPLLMRKKFSMKDVYFHKDFPEREVFRFEVAFDTEMYVLLLCGAALLGLAVCKIAKLAGSSEKKRLQRAYLKELKKSKK